MLQLKPITPTAHAIIESGEEIATVYLHATCMKLHVIFFKTTDAAYRYARDSWFCRDIRELLRTPENAFGANRRFTPEEQLLMHLELSALLLQNTKLAAEFIFDPDYITTVVHETLAGAPLTVNAEAVALAQTFLSNYID